LASLSATLEKQQGRLAATLDEARFASELELQPYLTVSDNVLFNGNIEEFQVFANNRTIFHDQVAIVNKGKTPVWIRTVQSSSIVSLAGHHIPNIKDPGGKSE